MILPILNFLCYLGLIWVWFEFYFRGLSTIKSNVRDKPISVRVNVWFNERVTTEELYENTDKMEIMKRDFIGTSSKYDRKVANRINQWFFFVFWRSILVINYTKWYFLPTYVVLYLFQSQKARLVNPTPTYQFSSTSFSFDLGQQFDFCFLSKVSQ